MKRPKKILIVEDEQNIRKILSLYFRREGFSVIETGDGTEAVSLAEMEKPSLMILDNMLPGVTGIDICRKLKSSDDTKGIVIVMLSADSRCNQKFVEYEVGADMYESKPFSPKELLNNIMQFVEPV